MFISSSVFLKLVGDRVKGYSLLVQFCPKFQALKYCSFSLIPGEMSTRKGGDGSRSKDENPTGVVTRRTTRSKRPIKIEMEAEENEDNAVVSKYFEGGEKKKGRSLKKESATEEKTELLDPPSTLSQSKKASPVKEESELKVKLSPSKKKNIVPIKVGPPKNWEKMLENIKIMRSTKTAAVDTMGCERTADLKEEPKVQRFQTLVSLILSSQTKDQVTFAAMERLKERGLTVQKMLDIKEEELSKLLIPVGFHNRKATYIKKVAGILREKYADDIPRTVEDLCALPGVGPKMAYICMNAAWNENAGIGVDTHVHRISNRLKWTGPKGTSTPEKTREALESWLPKDMWQEINILLVGFGQEICLPIGPKCETCLNKDICPSAQLARKSKKK